MKTGWIVVLAIFLIWLVVSIVGTALEYKEKASGDTSKKPLAWALAAVLSAALSFAVGCISIIDSEPSISTYPHSLEFEFEETAIILLEGCEPLPVYYTLETKDEEPGEPIKYTGPFPVSETAKVRAYAAVGPFEGEMISQLIRVDKGEEKPVESISLSADFLSLTVAEEADLQAAVLPEDATYGKICWTSSNKKVAEVQDGHVKAVGAGSAEIIAENFAGEAKAICRVEVKKSGNSGKAEEEPVYSTQPSSQPPSQPAAPALKNLVVPAARITLEPNSSYPINAYPEPSNADLGDGITWSTANGLVAQYIDGMIYTYSPGYTSITAECQGKVATVLVTVCEPDIEPTIIYSVQNRCNLFVGDEDFLPIGYTYGDTGRPDDIFWVSDDPSVAQVERDGTVYAVSEGICMAEIQVVGDDSDYDLTDAYCMIIVDAVEDSGPADWEDDSPADWEDNDPNNWADDAPVDWENEEFDTGFLDAEVKWPETNLESGTLYSPKIYGADGYNVRWESEDASIIDVDIRSGRMIARKAGDTWVSVYIESRMISRHFYVS